jgi:hypothetical protein
MIKKIISIATATLLLAGASLITLTPNALAAGSTDASLNLSLSSIKGVTLTSSTPTTCYDCALSSSIRGMANQVTVTLTPAQAANTSLATVITATDSNATVAVVKNADVMNVNDNLFDNSTNYNNSTTVIYDAEFIAVRVTAADTATRRYYAFRISAASTDATLSSVKIKGATATLGTPNATISSVVAGAVTITADSATATTASVIRKTDTSNFMPAQVKKFVTGSNPSASDFTGTANFSTGSITDGDIIVIKSMAADGLTTLYYKIVVTIGAVQQQNNSTPSVDNAAIAAAAAKAAAAVAAAKTTIVETLKSGKPLTVTDLNAADIRVASEKAAARVNTKLLALPVEKRTDIAAVAAVVRTENFVDKASSDATQRRITPRELVAENLVPADYMYKYTVLRAVFASNPASLDSIEKIEAVVDEAMAKIQARKDRLAAVKARIQSRK